MKKRDQYLFIFISSLISSACSNTVYVTNLESAPKNACVPEYQKIADELPPDVMNSWIPPGISKFSKENQFALEIEESSKKDRLTKDKKITMQKKLDAEFDSYARSEQQKREVQLRAEPPGAHKADNSKKMLNSKIDLPSLHKVDLPQVNIPSLESLPNINVPQN